MAEVTTAPVKEKPKFQAPKKKKKWVKRVILIAVLLVVAVAALMISQFKAGSGGLNFGPGISYLPAAVQPHDMTVAVTGPGTVKPNDTYKATALVKGEVLSAPFDEGQVVQKDDVLFTIDAKDVENAIKQAKTSVEQAKIGVEQATTGVEQAELGVRSAQLNYDTLVKNRNDNATDRQVKANATGVVNKRYVDPGDTVAAGTPIADILDRDSMKLAVPFHSVDAAKFTIGQTATVTVGGTAETLSGIISEMAATDMVGPGGTLTRLVTIVVPNPGALSEQSTGAASVSGVSSAASANFRYNASKQLVALYSGKLEKLSIAEGDRVTDGQVVGEFEEKSFQEQIDGAAISLDNAKLSHRNAQSTLRNAENSLRSAQDNLQKTQDMLEDYTITSPIQGTVIEKNYKPGDNIDPTTAAASGANPYLAVIYDMSRLTFDLNVDELDVVKLKVGQLVRFTADALEGQSFTGVVEKININGTTMNGKTTYPVTVAVDGDGAALARQGLFPGMNVSASIVVEEVGQVLAIPVDAVERGNVVWVAGKGALNESGNLIDPSKLEEREITLGRNDEEYIEVLSGLEEGDTVFIRASASNPMAMMMGG